MAFFGRGRGGGTVGGDGRFRRMFSRLVTSRALWPGLVGVAIAVGLGVQAGESTISLINPVHYRGEAPPVRAFDPNAQPAPAEASYADGYGWAAGDAARRTDSGIDDFGSMPRATVQPAGLQTPGPPPASLAPWPPGEVGPPAAPRPEPHVQIDHFTDFPIETKPANGTSADTPAPQPAAAPAAQPAAALSPAQAGTTKPAAAQ